MRKTGLFLLALALIVVVFAYPLALLVDRTSGIDAVILTNPADEGTVALNRSQFDDTLQGPARREAIASLYGTVAPGVPTERLVFVDDAQIVRPAEDQDLVLVRGEPRPLQAKTLTFAAQRVIVFGLVAAAALLIAIKLTGAKKT
jgi:hypothetical protein